MKTLKMALVAVLFLGFSTAAHAEDLVFELINRTSFDIVAIQVSVTSTDDWEENLIEGYILPSGNSVDVTIADGARVCEYDLLLTFDDGDTIDDRNLDLCEMGSYTAHE